MTTTTLLDPMPEAELVGHFLDLGRPELRELMNRYSCMRPAVVLERLSEPDFNPCARSMVRGTRHSHTGLIGPTG